MTRNPLQLPRVGSTFADQFELLALIGQGGMGVVYRARQLKLQREVALKVLRPEVVDNGYEPFRLEREAVSAARFRSRHVVSIHDWGVSADGLTYLVMELLHGETLAQHLQREGALKPSQLAVWLGQCSDALDEAAALGIVHRDIKPANLFLSNTSSAGAEIKILDFGITKFFDPSGVDFGHEVTTRSNLRLGTTHYMSPEQLRATNRVDARADIWSLGVVVYHALSGGYPFDCECEADLIVSILSDEPKPLHLVDASLSQAVAEAVARALEKNVDSRYSSAGEFARALSAALTRDPSGQVAAEAPIPTRRALLPNARVAPVGTEIATAPPLETRASNDSSRAEGKKFPIRQVKNLAITGMAFAVTSALAFTASRLLPRAAPVADGVAAKVTPPQRKDDAQQQPSPRENAPSPGALVAAPARSLVRVPVPRPAKRVASSSTAVVANPSVSPSASSAHQFERANPYAD